MQTLFKILQTMVVLAAIGAAVAAVVGIELLAPTKWLPDLATFFMPYIALAAAAIIIAGLMKLRPKIGIVGLAAVAAGVFVSVAPGNSTVGSSSRTLRLTTFNVLFSNFDPEPFRAYMERMDPDVVVLQEAGWPWTEKTLEWSDYPYRVIRPERRLIVLSKLPILDEPLPVIDTNWGTPRNINAVRLQLSLEGRPTGGSAERLTLYAIHAPTPRIEHWWHLRNSFLKTITDRVVAEPPGSPVVVAGDWNTPIWSPYFRRFMADTGLRPSHSGLWPEATRFFREADLPTWFGSTIDHVAVSADITPLSQVVGPDVNSDHLPVTVDLAVR